MLTGIAVSFGPGIALFVIPTLVGVEIPGLWVLIFTTLTVPILPFFYSYAIFKRQFGELEFRANRILGLYSFVLLYMTAFGISYAVFTRWMDTREQAILIGFLLSIAFALSAPSLRTTFQRTLEKLAYGAVHDPDEIISLFSDNLPAASDREGLISLLTKEIEPTLFIRQSALYLLEDDGIRLFYSNGLETAQDQVRERSLRELMIRAGKYRPPTEGKGELAWVRLPVLLEVQDRTIGVWLLGSRDPDDYYPRKDIQLLQSLANQVGLAIENTRLYSESRRQMEELSGLYDIAIATGSVLETKRLLQRLYQQVARLIRLDTFVVALFDPVADEYYVVLAIEEGKPILEEQEIRHPVSEGGLTGWVMRSGQSLLVSDLDEESTPVEPLHQGRAARSWLGVPLIARERLIGAVSIQSFKPKAFDKTDHRFLEGLAGQVAIALENALLFDETRHRAAQQEALNAVIAAVASAPELKVLLEIALDHSLKALNVDRGAVWVDDPLINQVRGLPADFHRAASWVLKEAAEGVDDALAVDDWKGAPDDSLWSQFKDRMTHFGVESSLIAPLLVGGRRIGGLSVVASSPRTWSDEEIALSQAIGRQLGGAVERLRLLEQVQEKARQVRRILDTVQEGILTLDEDRRVILANPAAERYLSAVADARVGDVLTKIGDKKITDLLMPRPGGLPHIVEITDPEERVFEVLANIFSVGPEIKGWTLLIREATEAHHVQQLAQQRDRLAAVGQLAAGIAHDFNNIMAAIILYAEMLLNSQELGEKSKERLNTILNQAQRAATLTRQILDFSRQAVMEQHPMDLIPFIREFEKLLARTLPESITINLDYDEQDFILRADPGRLQQVFMNLALNARDAMPQGGELTFSLKRINVRTYEIPPIREMPPGEWIQVSVSDTGEGISQEALPHIFEPFFTTKPPGEGTGLGLAQVYGIVKQHDGYINVKSTHGRGAAFNIYLPPMRVAESKYELPQPEDVAHGSGERILVVEDDPATREGVREVLEMLNYQVMVASDGQRAQEIFERGEDHFDLVVTDLVMPGVGGMALYKYLLKNVPGIRIIMMTGYPLGEGTRELLDQGKVTWIQKPLDSEMLGRAVHDALAGEASPAG